MSIGLTAFKLAFQLSPILLCDGIAAGIPGRTLPIIVITQAASFLTGLLTGSLSLDLDDFFAHFQPMPGATLVDNQIGTYPFANQAVAGNAIIRQPLALSLLMRCPARDELGYAAKLVTFIALKAALDQHNAQGGTYTVITPSFFYTNGILTALRDVSDAQSHQVQNAWQWDFSFPLLTLNAAQSAQNSLMSQITGGTQISGQPAWSGLSSSIGAAPGLSSTPVGPTAALVPVTQTPLAPL